VRLCQGHVDTHYGRKTSSHACVASGTIPDFWAFSNEPRATLVTSHSQRRQLRGNPSDRKTFADEIDG
jgi:hypothetical protein